MYFLYSQHIELLSMLQQLQSVCAVVSPVNPYVSTQNSSDAGPAKGTTASFWAPSTCPKLRQGPNRNHSRQASSLGRSPGGEERCFKYL